MSMNITTVRLEIILAAIGQIPHIISVRIGIVCWYKLCTYGSKYYGP